MGHLRAFQNGDEEQFAKEFFPAIQLEVANNRESQKAVKSSRHGGTISPELRYDYVQRGD